MLTDDKASLTILHGEKFPLGEEDTDAEPNTGWGGLGRQMRSFLWSRRISSVFLIPHGRVVIVQCSRASNDSIQPPILIHITEKVKQKGLKTGFFPTRK